MTQDSTGTGPQFREAGNGCRTIHASPSDVRDGRLKQLIEVAATGRTGNDNGGRVTIRLQPGRNALEEPIVLREQHSNLNLRGSPEADITGAAPGFEKALGQGLIVLAGANNVTITGLELVLRQVPATLAQIRACYLQDKTFAAAVDAIVANRYVSIGIRPVHCAALTNTIRPCYAGIWLTDATAAALTDLGGTFKVAGELKGQVAAVHAALVTGLLDPVLVLLTVFERTFPLSDLGRLTPRVAPAVNSADLPKLRAAGERARQGWMTRFVNDVAAGLTQSHRRAGPGRGWPLPTPRLLPGRPTSTRASVAKRPSWRKEAHSSSSFGDANADLAALARLDNTTAQSALMLQIERNDIECGLEQLGTSGPATFIYVLTSNGSATSAEVTANRLSSVGATPAAVLLGVASQAITGNIVTVTDAKATSLTVAASPHVAITGNVIGGTPVIPANRPFPAPLDSWLTLNTIVGPGEPTEGEADGRPYRSAPTRRNTI
jgi:hypothetical protein